MWKVSTFTSFRVLFRGLNGTRYSTAGANLAAQTDLSISKEVLLKMRKETGYSYVKCRKALVACGGEQNYQEALRWIREAAVKEGWDKAAKLSSRKASQGLLGFASPSDNLSVLVELNCETDFVARSAEFKNLVVELVNALQKHAFNILPLADGTQKLAFKNIAQDKFHLMDGRTAEEAIVATVGKIRENIQMTRALIISSSKPNKLFGQTHPKEEVNGVQLGRFISMVSLVRTTKEDSADSHLTIAQLGQQICQHIIGMAPECLGEPGKKREKEATSQTEYKDSAEKTSEGHTENTEADTDEDLNASQVDQSELTRMDENETQLLRQPFMLDPEQTVSEYLELNGAGVSDFVRIEMGQDSASIDNANIQ